MIRSMTAALLQSDLPFPVRRGKVRDVYDLGENLLIVATDRISAFDCIMPNGIPDKGRILTALSLFWFAMFKDIENHLIATEVADYPAALKPFADQLSGRSMLVKKASVIQIECVARGYLAGSGWKEYQKSQTVCGVSLPWGLRQCDQIPDPIFTPATKEESGHDINIDFAETVRRIGQPLADELRCRTLSIYTRAADYARGRGVIIADTKFEFGQMPDGRLILVDEILTPDSSRFWPADKYQSGRDQESFDKQFVRNWLEGQPWDKTPPAPALPEEVVAGTRAKYAEAYERLTGREW
ncbi:phosphoribosylaminoimidazolesuccinocarboxamide synthase [Humisphaera borealis]|uniref:Phosphoribosylaminoimidazole-succinocarboxamide synthase n=2 Tax=Humisphaera borealis TaxID=2807512 RepID=A0A7M2WZV9_9BACT|nr:phosphoribosylaminoimidazolesuccinocarboxamide synthase [Humisphaera borealis]